MSAWRLRGSSAGSWGVFRRDDDLAADASSDEIADRVRDLIQRDDPVDGGGDRPGLDQRPERVEVGAVRLGDEGPQTLAHEERQHHGGELAVDASGEAAATLTPDDDQRPVTGENAAEPGQRPVAPDVEDDVVALAAVGDVGARVVIT